MIRPRKFRINFKRLVVIRNRRLVISEIVIVNVAAIDENKFIVGIKFRRLIQNFHRRIVFALLVQRDSLFNRFVAALI